jgi:cardiolipin synthase
VLEPVEARIMIVAAVILLAVGVVVAFFPKLLAYPMAAGAIWVGVALLYRSYRLKRAARRSR